jgi:Flp pilus assembly protein protease CpaA
MISERLLLWGVALPLTAAAGYYDAKQGEIPEWLNYLLLFAIPALLALSFVTRGAAGITSLALVLLFFALWYFSAIGGADAKVFMLLSAVISERVLLVAALAYLFAYVFLYTDLRTKVKWIGATAAIYLLIGRGAYLVLAGAALAKLGMSGSWIEKLADARLLPYAALALALDSLPSIAFHSQL